MNIYLAWSVIILLILIIAGLTVSSLLLVRKVTPLSKKEKEFIEFAVNMYIKYAEELEITSPEQHEYLVKELEKIKKRYLDV